MYIVAATILGLFFAANIGASGTAASMGAAYGGGALKNRTVAVILVAIFCMLGANIGGKEVVLTISKGIIPEQTMSIPITFIILLSCSVTLFTANRLGIPLSTSEVTVGSIVGAGLAFQHVYWGKVLSIVSVWFILPVLAFVIAFALGRLLRPLEKRWLDHTSKFKTKMLVLLLIISGCYEAFSAGMNNVANAIGPLIAAGVMDIKFGMMVGSFFLALGAITMGGKVLETNGKKIASMNLLQGSAVSCTSGSLVIIASLFGIPVPLTQATTMAIIGVGSERVGWALFRKPVIKTIWKVWIFSPISSLVLTFCLIRIVMDYSLLHMTLLAAMISMLGFYVFLKGKYRKIKASLRR